MRLRLAGVTLLVCLLGACGSGPAPTTASSPAPTPTAAGTPTPTPTAAGTPAPTPGTAAPAPRASPPPPPEAAPSPTGDRGTPPDPEAAGDPSPAPTRPGWLGTRPLPVRPDGFGAVLDTPEELQDRRLPQPEPPPLPPPVTETYAATVDPVPADVAARSTWTPECPVALEDLRYLTVVFWGFDGAARTGELIVHASAADDLVEVFRELFDARFPVEEMRVVSAPELDAPPTGDGNNTTAFVCRPVAGGSSWSQHAYGLAVDVNPFHNPYVRGDLVLPELASAYADRAWDRPGMIQRGDVVTEAFRAIGWGWGGDWASLLDYMHFSASGR